MFSIHIKIDTYVNIDIRDRDREQSNLETHNLIRQKNREIIRQTDRQTDCIAWENITS